MLLAKLKDTAAKALNILVYDCVISVSYLFTVMLLTLVDVLTRVDVTYAC